MESRCNVLRCTANALYVLQQADHLGDRLGQGMFKLLRNGGDLRSNLRPDVAFDQIIDLIEPSHGPNRMVREVYGGVDQQLLRQLDDGAVCAADVLAGAALRAEP